MGDAIRNLGSIFVSPREVAIRIGEKPYWILPLIAIIVINFVMIYVTYPLQSEFMRKEMVENLKSRGLSDEMIEGYLKITPAKRILSATIGGILGTVVIVLLASAILNVLSPLVGSKIGFKKMMAYSCYIFWISSVGSLIRGILMISKGTYDVRTSVAAFAPSLSIKSPLGVALSSLDLFTIWSVIALGIGFAELAQTTKRKSFTLIIVLWAVLIAISVAFAKLRMRSS